MKCLIMSSWGYETDDRVPWFLSSAKGETETESPVIYGSEQSPPKRFDLLILSSFSICFGFFFSLRLFSGHSLLEPCGRVCVMPPLSKYSPFGPTCFIGIAVSTSV